MITFLCVKQIGYELLVKKRYKQMEIFLLKKMVILSFRCLFLDKKIQDKFVWIQKMIKGLLKRNFENKTLYVVRIKIRLNLIRYINSVINSKLMQDKICFFFLFVGKTKFSWNTDLILITETSNGKQLFCF